MLFCLLLFGLLPAACAAAQPEPTPAPPEQGPLVIYGWSGYLPQSILDAFTAESGIPVEYLIYSDQEEAMQGMHAGNRYDLVILSNVYVPMAVSENLLSELDKEQIPNFRNVAVNFRNLAYDPESRYSIMIQWGTTGLVVRTDRVVEPVTSWGDMWNPAYVGKVGIWPYPTDMIGITLKALGYSYNSEEPQQLNEAEEKLLQLRKNVFFLDPDTSTGAPHLLDDKTVMIYGWTYDAVQAQEQLDTAVWVLPKEGTFLWTDNVTIPRNSLHKEAAEQFINFLLRAEVSAQMVNELSVPTSNEAARAFIKPEILNDPLVYPSTKSLQGAEFRAALSKETQERHAQIWERFLAAEGEPLQQ
jgi:spermidine/putrescine transport system substrate-binding protein